MIMREVLEEASEREKTLKIQRGSIKATRLDPKRGGHNESSDSDWCRRR